MSPRRAARAELWPLYAGITLIALVFLVIMLGVWREDSEPDRSVQAGSVTSDAPTPGVPEEAGEAGDAEDAGDEHEGALSPTVVDWGGSGDQVVVVLRNEGSRTIRRAQVALTARNDQGMVVAQASDSAESTCCTVVGLPPGGEFGVFLRLHEGAQMDDVADVEIRYDTITFGAADAPLATVEIRDARLRRTPVDTLVHATLSLDGTRAALRDLSGYVAGQAFLVDPDDDIVGVISGRFYCFSAAQPSHRVAMQLLRPVPPGTRVARVLAYPVTADAGLPVPQSCPSTVVGES